MRNLDSKYFTPVLRAAGLIRLNSYGLFMTRSLAENYPYSNLYKAELQGRPDAWRSLVEAMEGADFDAESALRYVIARLDGKATEFAALANSVIAQTRTVSNQVASASSCLNILVRHIETSDYAARLMEVAMHSLCQSAHTLGAKVGLELTPLAQMRQANKKHKNVGDIEWTVGDVIVESWDAKFGIAYLRDELEELAEKLEDNPGVEVAGFVTDRTPERLTELAPRMAEIASLGNLDLQIVTLQDWVARFVSECEADGVDEADLAKEWLIAYAETIGLRRRDIAPIDEPSYEWLNTLSQTLELR